MWGWGNEGMLQHGLGKERSVACGDGEMRACYNMAWAKRGVLHVGMRK